MIYGLGIDITDIVRISKAYQKNHYFAEKVLSDRELEVFHGLSDKRKLEFLAGRFSAKESYSKAFGTGIGTYVSFQSLTILDDEKGKPIILEHPGSDKGLMAHISISHTDNLVMTEVILEQ